MCFILFFSKILILKFLAMSTKKNCHILKRLCFMSLSVYCTHKWLNRYLKGNKIIASQNKSCYHYMLHRQSLNNLTNPNQRLLY